MPVVTRSIERGVLTLLAVWLVTLVAVTVHVGSAWMPAAAFSSGLLVLLLWNPARRDVLWSLGLGALAGGFYKIHGGSWNSSPLGLAAAWLAFFGIGSLARLSLNWLWASPVERSRLSPRLRCAAFMPAMCVAAGLGLGLFAFTTPNTFDRLLLAIDLKYGIAPTWGVAGWFASWPLLAVVCKVVYYSLPAVTSVCLVMEQRSARAGINRVAELQHVAVAIGLTGLALYQLCPATGPVTAFSAQFPRIIPNVLDVSPGWVSFTPRNAMPSLHMAAALALFWNLRGRRAWLSFALLLFSGLTAIATLGTGEHYLVDLVAAPAVVVAAQALCSRVDHLTRWIALTFSAALTLGWILAARSGFLLTISGPAPMWILSVTVVVIPLALATKLEAKSAELLRGRSSSPRAAALIEESLQVNEPA